MALKKADARQRIARSLFKTRVRVIGGLTIDAAPVECENSEPLLQEEVGKVRIPPREGVAGVNHNDRRVWSFRGWKIERSTQRGFLIAKSYRLFPVEKFFARYAARSVLSPHQT